MFSISHRRTNEGLLQSVNTTKCVAQTLKSPDKGCVDALLLLPDLTAQEKSIKILKENGKLKKEFILHSVDSYNVKNCT